MKINARVQNSQGQHQVSLRTNDHSHELSIPPRPSGSGSSVNGGELLFLALATCYCNDLYREAAKRGLTVNSVEVEVEGHFGAEGEGAHDITYRVKVSAQADEDEVQALLRHTDTVAEVHNTLRAGTAVTLAGVEIIR